MITMEDCLAFSELTEEEILAIAEHEHIPEQAAIAYGEYLLTKENGTKGICKTIVDDIRDAQQRDDRKHTLSLLHVLHHFIRSHPESAPEQHPWSEVF